MKHIVIVGGGFAGIKLARELQDDNRFQITLISARKCFEYHAALYRSATGRSPLEVAVPLSEIFAGTDVDVVHDTVEKIDGKKQTLRCKSGQSYHYDELVLALGTVTAYFGIQGLPEYSYGIKTIGEAIELKSHLHAELTSGHKPDLHYVVVGAGPTGVELAAELIHYLKQIRQNHRINKPYKVELVEAAPRILPALPERLARSVKKRLDKMGAKIYTDTAVKGETADELQLPEGNIQTHTVVWTAGMTNAPLFAQHPKLFKLGKGQRVEVDEKLSAASKIWIAGDSAATPKSGLAQTAVYDGKFLADNFRRQERGEKLVEYRPPNPIAAIPAGPNWCAVDINGMQFSGLLGWMVRRWTDFKLFRAVMPFELAVRSWVMGTRTDEECPECQR